MKKSDLTELILKAKHLQVVLMVLGDIPLAGKELEELIAELQRML